MSLLTKYRPKKLSKVLGQRYAVAQLEGWLEHGGPAAVLLHGDSGIGKTTIARIIAKRGERPSVLEIDAATNTGVDHARELRTHARVPPGKDSRTIIVDEAHRLSGQAWDALLKIVEEPPKGVVWVFCTTVPTKVPKTIRTRCLTLALQPVSTGDLAKFITRVANKEGIELSDDDVRAIARDAGGSPRQALALLASGSGGPDESSEDGPVAFARALFSGHSAAVDVLRRVDVPSPEAFRIVACNFHMRAALDGKQRSLNVLRAFGRPYGDMQGKVPLILSLDDLRRMK